jgi:hypothetical protein
MHYVVIPFDFEQLPDENRTSIVPICIEKTDRDGHDIAWGWFEAAAAVQDPLRRLAGSWLKDVWRVSELAEASVHNLWYRHHYELGRRPSSRVLTEAKWYARDLQAGTWQRRRGVVSGLDGLDALLRSRVLTDPKSYEHLYHQELYYTALGKDLEDAGQAEVSEMLKLVRDGCRWSEVGERLGRDPDAARMKFRRWISRIVAKNNTPSRNCGAAGG